MSLRIVSNVFQTIFAIFCVVSISIGVLMLVSSSAAHSDETLNSFHAELFAIMLILLPLTMFFIAKTVKSYRGMNTSYGLPDTPIKSFLLGAASTILVIMILVTIAIYILILH